MCGEQFVVHEDNHVVVALGEFVRQFQGVDDLGILQQPVFDFDLRSLEDALFVLVTWLNFLRKTAKYFLHGIMERDNPMPGNHTHSAIAEASFSARPAA